MNIELGEPLERDTEVDEFVRKSRHNEIEVNTPRSIKENIPDMLIAAISTLRQRAAGSSDLEVSVNRADARVVSAISAWLIVELVRLYAEVESFDEAEDIDSLIAEEVADPGEQPPSDLVRSRYAFDSAQLSQELAGVVYIERESRGIVPGPEFPNTREYQIIALLLGRMAAYDEGFCEDPGVNKSWFDNWVNTAGIQSEIAHLDFIFENSDEGGYYIPGFRLEEALEYLNANS